MLIPQYFLGAFYALRHNYFFSMTRHIENFKIGCQEYEFLSLKFFLAIFVETGTIGEKINT
jgi:hypothetical protein